MKYLIRPRTDNDFPVIFVMVQELAVFVQEPEGVKIDVSDMIAEKDAFSTYL